MQVLVRHGEALERLAQVRMVLFDKTGTLTTHEPRVEEFAVAAGDSPDVVLATALEIATGSRHPLCTAIRSYAEAAMAVPMDFPRQVRSLPGRGLIACDVTGRQIALGSLRLMESEAADLPRVARGHARAAAGHRNRAVRHRLAGTDSRPFGFAEALRPEASAAIAGLKASGLHVAILTGDHPRRAERIGQLLGVPTSGGLLPDDKVAAVPAPQAHGGVAMVGDGINRRAGPGRRRRGDCSGVWRRPVVHQRRRLPAGR